MKARDQLHATLEYVPEKERKINAHKILDLSDEITEGYERMEHFNKHGFLPQPAVRMAQTSEEPPKDMSLSELFQRRQSLRTYISRYKRLEKTSKTLKAISRNRELREKYELELVEIERIIKTQF